MAIPTLTKEQRAAALAKASQMRLARATLKTKLKSGALTLVEVLENSDDLTIGKLRVSALLESLPKVGKVTAQELMTRFEIAPTRRVGGLGDRQRKALLAHFAKS